jgi:hypothetical protein
MKSRRLERGVERVARHLDRALPMCDDADVADKRMSRGSSSAWALV